MTEYKKIIARPITGTHLTEFKGYYELDLVNEFSSERFVFTIPKPLFDIMIFTKEKIKMVAKQRERVLERDPPRMIS